ncbi:MAG: hypothetical protein HUK15_01345 [Bacteroidales bacterium]|nr:hypothetical protein [Bacteroidales bacterium]
MSDALLIKENADAVLQYPFSLAKSSDTIFIHDQGKVYSLNLKTGDLEDYYSDSVLVADCYGAIQRYNYFDGRISSLNGQAFAYPHIVGIDKLNDARILVNIPVFEYISDSQAVSNSAVFVKNASKNSLLLKTDSSTFLSNNVPLGHFKVFLSDSLLLAPSVAYFMKNEKPDSLPIMSVFRVDDSCDMRFCKKVFFPYDSLDNLANPDDKYEDVAFLTTFAFASDDSDLYIIAGRHLYKYSNDGLSPVIMSFPSRVVSFYVDGDEINVIEKDENRVYSAKTYSLTTRKELPSKYSVPVGVEIHTCEFIGNELYVLFMKDENFYLLKA